MSFQITLLDSRTASFCDFFAIDYNKCYVSIIYLLRQYAPP